eukprot:scaffold1555_cov173-Amphora_coffeaeformis.AAC.12
MAQSHAYVFLQSLFSGVPSRPTYRNETKSRHRFVLDHLRLARVVSILGTRDRAHLIFNCC